MIEADHLNLLHRLINDFNLIPGALHNGYSVKYMGNDAFFQPLKRTSSADQKLFFSVLTIIYQNYINNNCPLWTRTNKKEDTVTSGIIKHFNLSVNSNPIDTIKGLSHA